MSEAFFRDLDTAWSLPERATLCLIGGTALRLGHAHTRVTNDADILETAELSRAIRGELLRLAARGTPLARRHDLYVEVIAPGLPFLPRAPRYHAVAFTPPLAKLALLTLDATDVAVSKLKRFHANDRSDIEAMVDAGHVVHADLVERFRSAVDGWLGSAYEGDLPRYVCNLHAVERDIFTVAESVVELPSYLDEA